MKFSPLVQELIDSLKCLPGVGAKSAQRMAFHLLERNRRGGSKLAKTLAIAMTDIGHCQSCRNFTEENLCEICQSPKRKLATPYVLWRALVMLSPLSKREILMVSILY